jgi:hypothetical protein
MAQPKKLSRTLGGVREGLFDALDALRAGAIDVDQAKATSELAKTIIAAAALQLDYEQAYSAGQITAELRRIELVPAENP